MAALQITWQRTCEYVATVDTAELRELLAPLPGSERGTALRILDDLEGRAGIHDDRETRELAYILNNTEAGREYFGGLADDCPQLCGGTGAPEVTMIEEERKQ